MGVLELGKYGGVPVDVRARETTRVLNAHHARHHVRVGFPHVTSQGKGKAAIAPIPLSVSSPTVRDIGSLISRKKVPFVGQLPAALTSPRGVCVFDAVAIIADGTFHLLFVVRMFVVGTPKGGLPACVGKAGPMLFSCLNANLREMGTWVDVVAPQVERATKMQRPIADPAACVALACAAPFSARAKPRKLALGGTGAFRDAFVVENRKWGFFWSFPWAFLARVLPCGAMATWAFDGSSVPFEHFLQEHPVDILALACANACAGESSIALPRWAALALLVAQACETKSDQSRLRFVAVEPMETGLVVQAMRFVASGGHLADIGDEDDEGDDEGEAEEGKSNMRLPFTLLSTDEGGEWDAHARSVVHLTTEEYARALVNIGNHIDRVCVAPTMDALGTAPVRQGTGNDCNDIVVAAYSGEHARNLMATLPNEIVIFDKKQIVSQDKSHVDHERVMFQSAEAWPQATLARAICMILENSPTALVYVTYMPQAQVRAPVLLALLTRKNVPIVPIHDMDALACIPARGARAMLPTTKEALNDGLRSGRVAFATLVADEGVCAPFNVVVPSNATCPKTVTSNTFVRIGEIVRGPRGNTWRISKVEIGGKHCLARRHQTTPGTCISLVAVSPNDIGKRILPGDKRERFVYESDNAQVPFGAMFTSATFVPAHRAMTPAGDTTYIMISNVRTEGGDHIVDLILALPPRVRASLNACLQSKIIFVETRASSLPSGDARADLLAGSCEPERDCGQLYGHEPEAVFLAREIAHGDDVFGENVATSASIRGHIFVGGHAVLQAPPPDAILHREQDLPDEPESGDESSAGDDFNGAPGGGAGASVDLLGFVVSDDAEVVVAPPGDSGIDLTHSPIQLLKKRAAAVAGAATTRSFLTAIVRVERHDRMEKKELCVEPATGESSACDDSSSASSDSSSFCPGSESAEGGASEASMCDSEFEDSSSSSDDGAVAAIRAQLVAAKNAAKERKRSRATKRKRVRKRKIEQTTEEPKRKRARRDN